MTLPIPPTPPPAAGSPGAAPLAAARSTRAVRGLVLLTVVVAASGGPLGLLWSWVAPPVPVRVTATGVAFIEPQPPQVVAADGWFALLGLAAGVLVAALAWRAAPGLRGPAGLVALTIGLVGAGLLAWWVGRQVGLASYLAALDSAEPGTVLDRPADLRVVRTGWPPVSGVPLAPALSAAVTYTLLAAWSRYDDLRPGRAAPGDPDPGPHPEPRPDPWAVAGAEPERP